MNISEGAWYVDLGIIAGVLTSFGIIWRMALWPGLKTFWLAITAAPRIADGIGKVVDLIEGDVLNELTGVRSNLEAHIVEAGIRDEKLAEHEQRLGKLEDSMFNNQKGC